MLGVAGGERAPDYLPLDDDHPLRAQRPYGLSKRLAEELCEATTAATGIPTICLRPFAVWDDDDYRWIEARRAADPESEWSPFWEYGAFVDVRDVAEACLAALTCPDPGHARMLLCAPDISAGAPARELAARLLPGVPWRGSAEYEADPWRALVDCTAPSACSAGGPCDAGRSGQTGDGSGTATSPAHTTSTTARSAAATSSSPSGSCPSTQPVRISSSAP